MGLYREINVLLVCLRCGQNKPFQVQFRTREGDQLQPYTQGQRIDDDLSSRLGDVYKSSTFLYCSTCLDIFQSAKVSVFFRALGKFTEDQLLTIIPSHRNDILSSAELLELGKQVDADLQQQYKVAIGEWGWFWLQRGGTVKWKNKDVFLETPSKERVNLDEFLELWETLDKMNNQALKEANWVGGINPYDIDIQVELSADRRIYVKSSRLAIDGNAE